MSTQLQITTLLSVVSIAFFNFFGISVTKNLSGASRCTIDACRTLFVWMFSLWAGWETFRSLEVTHHILCQFLLACLPGLHCFCIGFGSVCPM